MKDAWCIFLNFIKYNRVTTLLYFTHLRPHFAPAVLGACIVYSESSFPTPPSLLHPTVGTHSPSFCQEWWSRHSNQRETRQRHQDPPGRLQYNKNDSSPLKWSQRAWEQTFQTGTNVREFSSGCLNVCHRWRKLRIEERTQLLVTSALACTASPCPQHVKLIISGIDIRVAALDTCWDMANHLLIGIITF